MKKISNCVVNLSTVVPADIASTLKKEAGKRGVKVSQVVREKLIWAISTGDVPVLSLGTVEIPLTELDNARVILKKQEAVAG